MNAAETARFVEAIKKDSPQAKKNKVVTGLWVFEARQPQSVAEVPYAKGKVELKTELPAFADGSGTSPDPIQYCLLGLAACFGVAYAASGGVELTQLEVTAENWMDLRKQMGVTTDPIIERVKFTVRAAGPSSDVLQRLLKLAEQRCPGTECVTRSIPLRVELAPP